MSFLENYQQSFMLLLSGICATIALFVFLTKTIRPKRRMALLQMEVGSVVLLMAERFAYSYRGDPSRLGFCMVRISNYLDFFLILFLLFCFNKYIIDLYVEKNGSKKLPAQLKAVEVVFGLGTAMLTVSQFTGLYYTFDENNYYHRSAGFPLCYAMPMLIVVLQLSFILKNYKEFGKKVRRAILLYATMPIVASIVQLFTYGVSLFEMTLVGMAVLLYIFTLVESNRTVERAQELEMNILKEEQLHFRQVFEQTAEALASAIDAKDQYTHGHSRRVAEYSEKIARESGMDNKMCEEVYFAALLHDVGKIGIPDTIINKSGRLTDEEFAEIKKHPIIGKQILSSISRSPYLSIGANYHHERYDGKGYPEGLKGDDIPEIARIIAVADAYDAMTSKRSYRDPIPQQLVREEFVKGLETQFDPYYAKIMLHLIDLDSEYMMKERDDIQHLSGNDDLINREYRSHYSEGIPVTDNYTDITIRCTTDKEHLSPECIPTIVLFDALDGMVHEDEKKIKDLLYFEYAEIRLDGETVCRGARDIEVEHSVLREIRKHELMQLHAEGMTYHINAVRYKDHLRLIIRNEYRSVEVIVALPDSTRFSYIGLTGEHCTISDVDIQRSKEKAGRNNIRRIADEISYIDAPAGDIPNVQVDGWLAAVSQGILLTEKMLISFHTMSLPTARLVWHCPFIVLYSSDDGKFGGENYREFVMIRMDGESWGTDPSAENKLQILKTPAFEGWEAWKKRNKEGLDCSIMIVRKENTVTISTANSGITTQNVTTISGDIPSLYVALTGDQCALTGIRIS